MELRIRRIIRWNAAVMVIRANHLFAGLGGHLSTYASSASLYEVGFNHFLRGKGKVIQELEALFTGAGWNVIKVIWAREWDALLAQDYEGALVEIMNDTVDGEWQRYSVESGGYIRERFFGKDPRTLKMVGHLT